MKLKVIFLSLLLANNINLFSQVKIEKSDVDFSIKLEKGNIFHILTFWKDLDSDTYSSVRYSFSDFNQNKSEIKLTDEIEIIQELWNIADDSINFKLKSFNIGYPLLYSDILRNQVRAFLNSEGWQNHIKQNGKILNYEIIKKVMLEYDVYKPLNDFLKTKKYQIAGFETEKHGFVTKENLLKAGFTGNEIIPMPYIVWVKLEEN